MENTTKKICNDCKVYKQKSEFSKNAAKPDGISSICRSCASIRNKQYYLKNSDARKAKSKEYRTKNYEHVLESNKNYRHKNPKKAREFRDRWRVKNVETINQHTRNRRARKNKAVGIISIQEWEHLLDFYDYKCLCCKRTDTKLTLDHVVPLKLGGENKITNAQPLCGSCNSSKGARIIDYRPERI